jgi:hypothetical protein
VHETKSGLGRVAGFGISGVQSLCSTNRRVR